MPDNDDKMEDGRHEVEAEKKEMADVTSLIESASIELTVAEPILCRESGFNLQDSMTALEIMDRKMDCCEIPASQVAPLRRDETNTEDIMVFPRPPPIGLDDVIYPIPWNDLTLEDALFVSLESMVRFEALLSGASVVESTYTLLLCHKPVMSDMKGRLEPSTTLTEQMQAMMKPKPNQKAGTLPQQIVYTSALMLLELTDCVRLIILNADIYEEEDFTVNTYNIPIFNDRDQSTTLKKISDILELLSGIEDRDRDDVLALECVLSFQLDFFKACTALAKLSGTNVRNRLECTQKVIRGAASQLETLLRMLTSIIGNQTDASREVIRKVFDPNVNRPLVGNAPVRKVVFKQTKKSISLLLAITKQMDWAVCEVMLKGGSLGRINRMLRFVSVSSANILSRSFLVLNLYFDDKVFGLHQLLDMIIKHMQLLSHAPDNLFSRASSQAFLNRLAKPIYDILKVLILNRNRQRAYIEAVMLHDWAALRHEAHMVDLAFSKETGATTEQQPHFSLYILHITIGLMDHFVSLGIELKLFQGEDDLPVAYWYRDFLLSSLISQLSTMRRAKLAAKQAAALKTEVSTKQNKGKRKSSKHKKGSSGNNQVPPPSAEDIENDIEFLLLNLERTICRGLVRFLAAIKQAGLVRSRVYEFTTEQRIFEKRFEAFSTIQQPPPLEFQDYVQGSDFSKVTQNDLISSTGECFAASKALVDKLQIQVSNVEPYYLPIQCEELNKLAKVCVGNSVYLQKLKQQVGSKEGRNIKIDMDVDTHEGFCTIKLT